MSAMTDLHRDENGRPMLVGPDCGWCDYRTVLTYGCTRCDETFDVPGHYIWSWQGKSHRHIADDEPGWIGRVVEHTDSHSPSSVLITVGELAKLRGQS